MISISKQEQLLLITIILSPFAAVPAVKFFRIHKTLSKDYEVEWEEMMGKLGPITITHRRGL